MQATCAAIVGKVLPESAGPDSFNMLPALLIPRGKKAPELYNLEKDLAETTNVSAKHPEVTKELVKLLKWIKTNKSSRKLERE